MEGDLRHDQCPSLGRGGFGRTRLIHKCAKQSAFILPTFYNVALNTFTFLSFKNPHRPIFLPRRILKNNTSLEQKTLKDLLL